MSEVGPHQDHRRSDDKYRLLFDSIDQGFCLIEILFDDRQRPVDYRFLEINAAFERQTGLHDAVGKRMLDLVPQHEQSWFDVYGRVALTGAPARFESRAAALDDRWYDVYAFRIGAPADFHVAVLFNDITDRKHAEALLRESEERQTFLLQLGDALRAEDNADAIVSAAIKLLATKLRLDRCYVVAYRRDEGRAYVTHQIGLASLPPLPDFHLLADYPESVRQTFDRTLVVNDAAAAPGLTDAERHSIVSLGQRAFIVPSLRKGEKNPIWAIVAASAKPRHWTRGDITLVEEVTERTWAACERTRIETARRKSEARYHLLFDSIDESFAIIEMIDDAAGRAIDYRILETNPAFAVHTGITDAVGRTARDLVPGIEPQWINIYGQIADSGQPERFTQRVAELGRHYDVYAFPVGDPAQRRVAVLANDVSAREQAQIALRSSEGRLQTLMQGIPQLVWRAGGGGHWTWSSPQWTAFTGLNAEESNGLGWLQALHPDDRGPAQQCWAAASTAGQLEMEGRLRQASSGDYRWFQTRATPVHDDRGQIVEWLGTSTDVHDMRALQERQKVLVAELQHRTRNLMGVVRSITDKTARSSRDLTDFRDQFRDRMNALARVQGLLSRANEYDRVTFDELIHTELAAMGGRNERISAVGPPGVRLRSSTVQILALALHELATNAMKHGALSQPDGNLTIRWSFEESDAAGKPWLHLDWRESGVKMPAAADRGGQGRELIEQALPYQLKARTSYEIGADGIHCTFSIPVSENPGAKEPAYV